MKRARLVAATAAACLAAAFAACSFRDLSDIQARTPDGGSDVASDTSTDDTPLEAGEGGDGNGVGDADATGCVYPQSGCGPGPGCPPCGVTGPCDSGAQCTTFFCNGGSCDCPGGMAYNYAPSGAVFCIDSTEVAQSDYAQALAACAGIDGGCSACTWSPTEAMHAPVVDPDAGCIAGLWDPDASPMKPVTCVRWCDALAYCQSQGKRLCASYNAGPTPVSSTSRASAMSDEWFNACSNGGASSAYPYALDGGYDPTACNGADLEAGGPVDVSSLAKCHGVLQQYPTVWDMSGNVREWENSCDLQGNCIVRGGSYASDPVRLRCDYVSDPQNELSLDTWLPDLGFRCCGG